MNHPSIRRYDFAIQYCLCIYYRTTFLASLVIVAFWMDMDMKVYLYTQLSCCQLLYHTINTTTSILYYYFGL